MLGRGAPDANPGSKTVVRKTMELKSNTKGVPEVPTSKSPETGVSRPRVRKERISKDGYVPCVD